MLRKLFAKYILQPLALEVALAIRPEIQTQLDRLDQAALDIPFTIDDAVKKAIAASGVSVSTGDQSSSINPDELAAIVATTDKVVAASKGQVATSPETVTLMPTSDNVAQPVDPTPSAIDPNAGVTVDPNAPPNPT